MGFAPKFFRRQAPFRVSFSIPTAATSRSRRLMFFTYVPVSSLPRLAWCALLHRNDPEITVLHGPWVETREDGFFEGAWDGSFDEGRPDEATTFTGSGARLVRDHIVFVTPTHMNEHIHSLRAGDDLYFSNSLPFLLERSDHTLDPFYPFYGYDLRWQFHWGLERPWKSIRLQNGNRAYQHYHGNLVVEPGLTITREEKRLPPPPTDFADYYRLLEQTVVNVAENAASPGRKQPFRPVTSLSRGYDSPAVAVLARHAGCREAVTFKDQEEGENDRNDCGAEIAGLLGLDVTVFDRYGYKKHPGLPEAEFCAFPFPSDMVVAGMQRKLARSLLFMGWHGDTVWNPDASAIYPYLQWNLKTDTVWLAGNGMGEFRLRTGFFLFPVPYIAALHVPAIHKITVSPEMKPWTLGGEYDRPIPRRILEEAGVPRGLFGLKKRAGAFYWIDNPGQLSETSRKDFDAFFSFVWDQVPLFRKLRYWFLHQVFRFNRLVFRANDPVGPTGLPAKIMDARFKRYPPKMAYLLHWGIERTRDRYALPGSPRYRRASADQIAVPESYAD